MTLNRPFFPSDAQDILELPGVEFLVKETDGWFCRLRSGWTTDALDGCRTITDRSLRTIRASVVGAYQIEVNSETDTQMPPRSSN